MCWLVRSLAYNCFHHLFQLYFILLFQFGFQALVFFFLIFNQSLLGLSSCYIPHLTQPRQFGVDTITCLPCFGYLEFENDCGWLKMIAPMNEKKLKKWTQSQASMGHELSSLQCLSDFLVIGLHACTIQLTIQDLTLIFAILFLQVQLLQLGSCQCIAQPVFLITS